MAKRTNSRSNERDADVLRADRAIRLVKAFDEAASGYAVLVATRQSGVRGAAKRYDKALRVLLKALMGRAPTDDEVREIKE